MTISTLLAEDYKKVKELNKGKVPKCQDWMKYHRKDENKIRTSYGKINREFGSWKNFVEELEKYFAKTTTKELKHKGITFINKKTRRIDWRSLIKHAQVGREFRDDMSTSQGHAKIKLDVKGRDQIAIVFTADWHLGSAGIDYDTFLRNMEYIIDTPNLYMAIIGDERDNFLPGFKSGSAVASQVLSPQQQVLLLKDMMQELEDKGKVLFSCWDNHGDEFDERTLGYSVQKTFIKGEKSVFFDGEGICELILDKTSYYIMAVHKTRFSSFLHSLHGAKRAFNLRFPANIVVTAHTHDGTAMELYPMYRDAEKLGLPIGGDNYLIKTGTYKVNDLYTQRIFGTPIIGNPTVVLRTDSRDITFFTDPVKAVTYMNSSYSPKQGG